MQPLKILNNVQKARLLHSLLSSEMPQFLGYLRALTETVLNDRERIAAEWTDQMFGSALWFELAAELQKVLAKFPKDLAKSAPVFADQLFGGFMAMFTVHALLQYTVQGKHTDPNSNPLLNFYSVDMEFLFNNATLCGLLLIAVCGFTRYRIGKRRFDRRGIGGVQHFSSYHKAVAVGLLERSCLFLANCCGLSGLILIARAVFDHF